MKKHAYLIMAHNNFYNLEKLLSLLDYEDNDIFLHIDNKVLSFERDYYENIIKNGNIYIYSKYSTNWGGYSLVECEMFLLEEAFKQGHYQYYHLLSGADLPIKKHSEIVNFFDKNNGYQFVQFLDEKLKKEKRKLLIRVKYYHFLQEYRNISKNVVIRKTLRYVAKILLGIQMVFRIDRIKDNSMDFKYGSQWFSITEEFVDYLMREKEYIRKIFKYTMCPDEFFIQTMLFNSGFKDEIYQYKKLNNEKGNVREINWKKSSDPSHPYVWTNQDFKELLDSKALFARKFEAKLDKEIIDHIYLVMKE